MSPLILYSFFVQSEEITILKSLKNVKSITQDKHGFIWFSGQQGLTRFDGKELISLSNHSDKWQLPFTWIHAIERHNDNFILSTETSGVWQFDPSTGTSIALPIATENQSTDATTYYQGNYYVIAGKLFTYNLATKQIKVVDSSLSKGNFVKTSQDLFVYNDEILAQVLNNNKLQPVFSNNITAVANVNDSLVIASKEYLLIYKNNELIAKLHVDYTPQAITNCYDYSCFFVVDGSGEIHKYDKELNQLPQKFKKITNQRIRTLYHDSSDVLWLASSQGISRSSQISVTNKQLIYKAAINAIKLEQYQGNIIVGSYGDGVHNYHKDKQTVNENLFQQLTDADLRVTDLQVVKDQLFIATFGGLWQYDLKLHQLKKVAFEQNNQLLLNLSLHRNKLYLLTDGNGFIVYDLLTQSVVKEVDRNYPFSSPEIIDIEFITENQTWLATAKDVEIYNEATDEIKQIVLPGSAKVISLVNANQRVFAFTKGSGIFVINHDGEILRQLGKGIDFGKAAQIGNQIWAPSRNGLYRLDIKSFQLSLIPNTEKFGFTSEPVVTGNTVHVGHYGGVVSIPIDEQQMHEANIIISKTTVSGRSYLLNEVINIESSNDVVQLDLASLDYRPGIEKQFEYQINNGLWYPVTANQLTLTGLASGSYFINIRGTNSLGQLSNKQAHAEIHVAYPWYWTPKIRVLYVVFLIGFISLILWLLYLRGRSISHIHALLANDIKTKGKAVLHVQKNLSNLHTLWLQCIDDNEKLIANRDKIGSLIEKSIEELNDNSYTKTPDGLYGKTLSVALPYLIDYAEKKYQVKVHYANDIDESTLSYELQSDIYTMLYHAITSAVLNGNGRVFNISLKEFKQKIWVTISDDGSSFIHYKSKINFDMAMYFIRQIANKYKASVNVFEEQQTGSQLVISVPLMMLS